MALRATRFFLLFAFLHIASSLVINDGNTTLKRALDLEQFPPKSPVSVEATLLMEDGEPYDLWIPVTIKGVDFKLLFDTGSLVTWVLSTEIKDEKYSKKERLPWENIDSCEPGAVNYGGGMLQASGVFVNYDTVVEQVEKKEFPVLLVDKVLNDQSDFFANSEIEGIFGAEVPPEVYEDAEKSWMWGTKFSVDIIVGGKSTVTFGDIDFGSAVTVATAGGSNEDEWVITIPQLGDVHVDTGTVPLILPVDYVSKYMSENKIKAYTPNTEENSTPVWMIDCGVDLPAMKIDLGGGKSVEISGSLLKLPEELSEGGDDNKCDTIITAAADGSKIILGLPLFKEHTVIFDRAGTKIGFQKR